MKGERVESVDTWEVGKEYPLRHFRKGKVLQEFIGKVEAVSLDEDGNQTVWIRCIETGERFSMTYRA